MTKSNSRRATRDRNHFGIKLRHGATAQVVGDPILPMIANCKLRRGDAPRDRSRGTGDKPEDGKQAEYLRAAARSRRKTKHAILLPQTSMAEATGHGSLARTSRPWCAYHLQLTYLRKRTSASLRK